ncbi:MAG: glycosyltransferase family 4 protein [Acidobacteria bacterium]|nr:glycosyltransferase family 4 protein [Acidobacteriota bacterium]
MALLAVVTSSPAGVEGGHMVIARSLVRAARDAGYDARLVVTPDFGFGRQTRSYLANLRYDVRRIEGRTVDQVISLRYPSYAVRHPRHVCWLNHTMREYYDRWPAFSSSISAPNRAKESMRRVLTHAADRYLLGRHVRRVVAQSQTIQRRLLDDFGIRAEVLLPPPPQRPYRCDGYGPEILVVSRLTPHKRVDLAIRAIAEPAAQRVRLLIVGDGDCRAELERLAATLQVAERARFLGAIDDRALVDHLARCRAVCFTPIEEDYGFVTVEAFASRKAVVTCRDSGGPVELVADGESGFVCDPTPSAIAGAMARLVDDRALAERLGAGGAARASAMSWRAVVRALVSV